MAWIMPDEAGNRRSRRRHYDGMDCTTCREAISADLDGESSREERAAVDDHLAECASCRTWALDAGRLHRQMRLRPAESVPDLAPAILAKAHPPSVGRWEWIRTALVVVALTELVLSVPALFGVDAGASVHVARHVGSLSAALAVGLLYAAWKPVRAYGLLPIALALAGCMLITSAIDLANGRVDALAEAHHVLELVAVVLLWALAGRPLPRIGGRTHAAKMMA
jgi:predicted anti-sigma-YlaC factor YlaD